MVESRSNSIGERLMGIITFKAPTYREVAEDTTATGQAASIVIVVALIVGLVRGFTFTPTDQISSTSAIFWGAVLGVINALIWWYIGSAILAWASKQFFNGRTDTSEMLRVVGFSYIFQILQVIPIIGGIVGGILGLIAYIIGIREAAEISTGQAVGTALIALIAVIVAITVVAVIFGVVFGIGFGLGYGMGAMTPGQ